jgi:hypothetical protein
MPPSLPFYPRDNFSPYSSTNPKTKSYPEISANTSTNFILYTNTSSSINSIPYAHINTTSYPSANTN